MIDDDRYTIRVMTRGEIDLAVDWAAAEGWNPGLRDADSFHAADATGFYVGLLGDEPVATISAVKYGADFGFVGFYIVKPQLRGRGFGLRVWNAALATLNGRNIALDGVVDQQDNYRKSGFKLAWRNIRFQGSGAGSAIKDPDIVPLASVAFDEIERYDREFFPCGRSDFLAFWIAPAQSEAVAIRSDGKLGGYAVMRRCRSGCKIGPLFAETPQLADRLFLHLRSRASGPIFLDIPELNPAARDLVQRHDMSAVFETARMYTGEFPQLPMDRLFGITTFELG